MLNLAITCLVVLALLLVGEFLQKRKINPEFTRKFSHITVGIFAASWPWFLSWRQIEVMSLAFLLVVLVSRQMKVFRSIHMVERKTVGEILYAISIGLTAFLTHDKYIFAAAILCMSLADGLAAVVGMSAGRKGSYKILGQKKTIAGSLTFWVCCFLILAIYFTVNHRADFLPLLIGLPTAAMILENVGYMGIDNLLVPLIIVIGLK